MMRAIQLDDVLDADFFTDEDKEAGCNEQGKGEGEDLEREKAQEVKGGLTLNADGAEAGMSSDFATTPNPASIGAYSIQGLQGSSTPSLIPSQADLAADAAAVKNLSRWDIVSVGTFRQTQHQVQDGDSESTHRHYGVGHEQLVHGRVRTPGSSADYGNAMKKSGKFALGVLWRGGNGGKRAVSNSPGSVQTGAMRRTASGGMIGSKQAKKRRLMMNSSSTSVMNELLVLPVTSIGAAGGSTIASGSTATGSSTNTHSNGPSKLARKPAGNANFINEMLLSFMALIRLILILIKTIISICITRIIIILMRRRGAWAVLRDLEVGLLGGWERWRERWMGRGDGEWQFWVWEFGSLRFSVFVCHVGRLQAFDLSVKTVFICQKSTRNSMPQQFATSHQASCFLPRFFYAGLPSFILSACNSTSRRSYPILSLPGCCHHIAYSRC